MLVETKNASLDTLSVTIQALHVNGKQMTLAVFRQLPQKREDSESSIWGVVNYIIKNEGDIWLVFSNNGVLYRRALNLSKPILQAREINSIKNKLEIAENRLKSCEKYSQSNDAFLIDAQTRVVKLKEELDDTTREIYEEFEEDMHDYNKEVKLSKLNQLFISV